MSAKLNAAGVIAAAMMLGLSAMPASALTIIVNNTGGLEPGSSAGRAFSAAAKFYERVFTNDVTVNVNAGFGALGFVGGSTRSTIDFEYTGDVEAHLRAGGETALDGVVARSLPAINALGDISMITAGYVDPVNHLGVDTTQQVYDTNDTFNNYALGLTAANAKVLGFGANLAPGVADAAITFHDSALGAFDFDPRDGINNNQFDFTAIALHELGHALGFTSGLEAYDYYGAPYGPGAPATSGTNLEDYLAGYALDLFRYSKNPDGFASGEPLLDWSPGREAYFSIDGGQTSYYGTTFASGAYNGDGYQLSHWQPAEYPCGPTWGIMAADLCNRQVQLVTSSDLAALDAIGWNTDLDLLNGPYRAFFTDEIYAAGVPEPGVWLMMVAGLGLAGMTLRRRRLPVATLPPAIRSSLAFMGFPGQAWEWRSEKEPSA